MMIRWYFLPGAEVTGKLAISLVNTTCIFEVFISVVLVGEYLVTTLTLKTFVTCIRQHQDEHTSPRQQIHLVSYRRNGFR